MAAEPQTETKQPAIVTAERAPPRDAVEGFIANDYFQRVNQGYIQSGQPAEYRLGNETYTVTPGANGAINIEQKMHEAEIQLQQQQQQQQELQQEQERLERERAEQERLEQQRQQEQQQQEPKEGLTKAIENMNLNDSAGTLQGLGQILSTLFSVTMISSLLGGVFGGGPGQSFPPATPQQLTAAAGPGAAAFDTDSLKEDIAIKTADGNDYVITENIDHFAVAPNEEGGFTVAWQNEQGKIMTAPVEEADSFGINQQMIEQGLAAAPKPAPTVQPGLQQQMAVNWTQMPGMNMGMGNA